MYHLSVSVSSWEQQSMIQYLLFEYFYIFYRAQLQESLIINHIHTTSEYIFHFSLQSFWKGLFMILFSRIKNILECHVL